MVITISMVARDADDSLASQQAAKALRNIANRIDGHPHFSPGHDQPVLDENGREIGFITVHSE